jgi:hypothetical protein
LKLIPALIPEPRLLRKIAQRPPLLEPRRPTKTESANKDRDSTLINGRRDNAYYTARIAQERPEILQRMLAGEYTSVRRAAIDAGIVREPTRVERLQKLWTKATDDERAQFRPGPPIDVMHNADREMIAPHVRDTVSKLFSAAAFWRRCIAIVLSHCLNSSCS